MKSLDDKTLSAFLDGELPEDEQRHVEALLGKDIKAQERLAQLQGNDALLKTAFGTLDVAPISETLQAQIMAASQKAPENNVVALPSRRSNAARAPYFWPASIAAALVIVMGVGIGINGVSNSRAPLIAQNTIEQGNPLYALLERTPSAQTINLKGNLSARAVMSLRLADNSLCREIVLNTKKREQRVLACRHDGRWDVRVQDQVRPYKKDVGFQTVSDQGMDFDNALDQLGAQTPLSLDEEKSLISAQWK